MTTPLLQARSILRQSVTGAPLLAGFDLDILAGDRLALEGRTGSGKTVLLRALAKLDPLQGGSILWRNNEDRGARVPTYRRSVRYLHQKPFLIEGTVADQLRLPYILHPDLRPDLDSQRVSEQIRSLSGRDISLHQPAEELSGGEVQLIALLRALQDRPTLLLLDEPTSAMDGETVGHVEEFLGSWLAEEASRAWIWVSHDPAQLARMCTRRILIESGVTAT